MHRIRTPLATLHTLHLQTMHMSLSLSLSPAIARQGMHHLARAAFIGLLAAASMSVAAQKLTPEQRLKVKPEVEAAASRGEPQTVLVVVDIHDIHERESSRMHARGLAQQDQDVIKETNIDVQRLQEEMFPGGRMGRIEVLRKMGAAGGITLSVPSMDDLIKLSSHPRVKSIHPNAKVVPYTSESLPLIGQPAVANAGLRGAGTRVAVIDTSFNIRNPGFSMNNSTPACRPPGYDSSWGGDPVGTGQCRIALVKNFTSADDGCWDTGCGLLTWHGEIDSAIVLATAPDTKIVALQVFTTGLNASNSDYVSAALDWLIENPGYGSSRIVAVNMSLGLTNELYTTPCSDSPYEARFQRLRSLGIVPVVAVGNHRSTSAIGSPACAPSAFRVGAVYDSNLGSVNTPYDCSDFNAKQDMVPCFSDSSEMVHVLAPGARITAGGLQAMGTSQAAPHVSGAIAALRGSGAFPSDSANASIARLTLNGKPVTDLRNNVTKPRIRLDAAAANKTPPFVMLAIPAIAGIVMDN